jgi:hypothetical protein
MKNRFGIIIRLPGFVCGAGIGVAFLRYGRVIPAPTGVK